jgi:hypothetical protein
VLAGGWGFGRVFGVGGWGAEAEDGLGARQEQGVAAAAGEEVDLAVGLAAVGLELERQAAVALGEARAGRGLVVGGGLGEHGRAGGAGRDYGGEQAE